MEIFGAISSGDHWRSSNLNENYNSSQEIDDHQDDHLPSDCGFPHYDLNNSVVNSNQEIPFAIWPTNDSTIVHDTASLNYHQFANILENSEWISINKWESDEMTLEPEQSAWNSKKRPRNAIANDDDQSLKNKRSVKPRKACSDAEEERPVSPNSPLSVFEHSNSSQEELCDGTTSTSGSKGKKTRASRGSATDPQSVYARKRREKINERLRVLQNLVPNGTKVDLSTMLEEAVEYVKFLQMQIKLLSSDDLWMYAPLAYNGMDIGVDRLRLTAQRLL